ncbi:hypothetical protein CALCODRAFT_482328, partial [Calocera cornea HHB12733]
MSASQPPSGGQSPAGGGGSQPGGRHGSFPRGRRNSAPARPIQPLQITFSGLANPHEGRGLMPPPQPRSQAPAFGGAGTWTSAAQAAWDSDRAAVQNAVRRIEGSTHDGLDLPGHTIHPWSLDFEGRVRKNVFMEELIPALEDTLTFADRTLGANAMILMTARLDNGPGAAPTTRLWTSRNLWNTPYSELASGLFGIFTDVIARGQVHMIDQYMAERARQGRNSVQVNYDPPPTFDARQYFPPPFGSGERAGVVVTSTSGGGPPPGAPGGGAVAIKAESSSGV